MSMKTVGELLVNARQNQGLTLIDISRQTRITLRYLEAIEANDFKALPPATFTKGFLRNYADAVGVDPATVLAIFRRDYDQDDRGRIIPRGLTEPVRPPLIQLNPTRISLIVSGFFGLVVALFFVRQLIIFTQAPPLNLIEPVDNARLLSPVLVRGTTSPEASVTINNEPVTVNQTGDFTFEISLSEGDHTLVVATSSRGGNQRTLQRQVYILPAN